MISRTLPQHWLSLWSFVCWAICRGVWSTGRLLSKEFDVWILDISPSFIIDHWSLRVNLSKDLTLRITTPLAYSGSPFSLSSRPWQAFPSVSALSFGIRGLNPRQTLGNFCIREKDWQGIENVILTKRGWGCRSRRIGQEAGMHGQDFIIPSTGTCNAKCARQSDRIGYSPIVASTSHVARNHLLIGEQCSTTVLSLITSTRSIFTLVDKPCLEVDVLITSLNLKPLQFIVWNIMNAVHWTCFNCYRYGFVII